MRDSEIRKHLIDARDEYIGIIKSEILGPGSEFNYPDIEHELISSSPLSRYSAGILFPQGNLLNQDSDERIPLDEMGDNVDSEDDLETNDSESEEPVEEVKKYKSRSYEFDETADENLDEEIGMSSQYMPSSMGITVLVKGNVEKLRGEVSFATYRSAKIPDCAIPYYPDNADTYELPPELTGKLEYDKGAHVLRLRAGVSQKEIRDIFEQDTIPESEYFILKQICFRFADYCRNGFVREPHHIPSFVVDFSQGNYVDCEENSNLDGTTAKIVALRTHIADDVYSVTVMLVNGLEEIPAKPNHCIFQPKISISTQNNDFVIVESNSLANPDYMDDEERSLELLYRHKKNYGTGLGTSVDWDINLDGQGAIWSTFFPEKEIPAMSFTLPENDTISDDELSMKYLSDLDSASKADKLSSLRKLVELYKAWVDNLQETAKSLDERYQSAAAKNIAECVKAYKRMFAGIEMLESNENAYKAFLLANRAMFMQRIHILMQSELSSEDRYSDDQDVSDRLVGMDYNKEDGGKCKWRPFQLAFLLMDVVSIADDNSDDKNIVDLIWFPTGGGKTEAYLGLTAFTIFYRKLAYLNQSSGTAVMMRYTLRLLAAQQFTRAATLICACEFIRQDCTRKRSKYPLYNLGNEPITIGLWIGGSHIPNKNDGATNSAKTHLDKLVGVSNPSYLRTTKDRHNKFQVLKCPWCGTKMVVDEKNGKMKGDWGYAMHNNKHFYMFCPQEYCPFTSKLPIQIIDEELYKNPPTLLFGTVDKFAMMPWDGRIGSFFAIGTDNRAPELIIQDELHLISGALGTMVGLYETAIDAMCSAKGVSPKVIASTATIRRAKEQCSVLYNREVVQFPAPGLDAEDSFFAREAAIDYSNGQYGRKYVGVMPSGKTKAMMEIRMMAALLQKLETYNLPDEVKDKLWTLTVYFNSLKDLGKASTLVDDDVKDFIIRTGNRMFTGRRLIVGADELTSRVSTTELNETLDKLERVEYSTENKKNKRYASNVLLATNMISVGIDVARLNVMLMVGQPKLTSEYIQASSRVGRSFPGVAFVQYDATKSRDRSHYERFRTYHDSFYRFVEPTGATPFSKPARERALHAVLTTMIRQKAGLHEDKDAVHFNKEYYERLLEEIKSFVLNRVQGINDRFVNGSAEDVSAISSEITDFFDYWNELAEECQDTSLYFGRRYMVTPPGGTEHRLLKQYNSQGKDKAKETLTSMRNVDSSVNGSVVVWEE